ncbi:MAG: SDR family NAD(P)-dependent oxidoreductase [Nevskia sp.]|nr:SDR family NAD(P)-dependent oxidoreductase [Nevskia sp.]
MSAHNILITGASSGLGYATVQALCARLRSQPTQDSPRIFITATLATTAAAAAAQLSRETGCPVCGLALDLGSEGSMESFLAELDKRTGDAQFSAIFLNAGIQLVNGLKRNDAGYELTMAVNQIGHLRLLFRLWNRIKPQGRVVFVGSSTHNPDNKLARRSGFRGASFTSVAQWLDGQGDPQRTLAQQGLDRYANSKLANIVTALELTRRVAPERMEFYAVDPGLMPGTGLARDHSWLNRLRWSVLRALTPLIPGASTPKDSAAVVAKVLLGELSAETVGGHYLDFSGRPAPRSALVDDAQAGMAMLDQMLSLPGIGPRVPQFKAVEF